MSEKPVQDASLVVHGFQLFSNKIEALMHETNSAHAV